MFDQILPNSVAPVLAYVTLLAGAIVVFGAEISLIGLGIQPPDPDWGAKGSRDGPHVVGAAPATRPEPHRH